VIERLRALLKRRSIELRVLAMSDVLNNVAALTRADAAARRVKLEIDTAPELPEVMDYLESQMPENGFLCGDFSVADLAVAPDGRSLVVPYTSSTGFKTATPPGSPLVLNESDDPFEADRCAIRSPASITGSAFTNSPVVFGQIGEIPFTPGPGADPVIVAQLGFGPATSNPQYQPGWTWIPAQFNVQAAPIEDEYRASFMLPLPGSYRYAYRFSRNGGAGWTYCDREDVAGMPGSGGSGSNAGLTFELEKLGVLTVTP